MSAMIDDETLQMYVEESREHLEDIESNLLEIEQAGEQADEDLVNKVFRAAHSIKGGAGFLGLSNIKELAHKIENVLDLIRNRELTPSSETVNIILLAFDRLSELIEDAANSNDMDISEHMVALQGLTSAHLPEEEKKYLKEEVEIKDKQGNVLFNVSKYDLNQAEKGGKFVYLAEYDLIHDVQRKNQTPLDVIKNMSDSGVILETKIELSAVATLDSAELVPRLPFFVLFASIIEPDLVPRLLDLSDEYVLQVDFTSFEEQPEPAQEEEVEAPLADSEKEKKETEQAKEPEKVQEEKKPDKEEEPEPKSQVVTKEETKPKQSAASSDKGDQAKDSSKSAKQSVSQAETLRVHVSVLDQLMNLAGELVLSRNQLLQSLSTDDKHSMQNAGQRIDIVTSELQEAIMLTRMQPIGNIFNKYPRVVRDMTRELGKEIELQLEGKEVELDKAIIEGLGDPLTHLVRNSADHGVESPQERQSKGKPSQGRIILRAYHESGQVNIEIEDDGKGMDAEKIAEKAVNKGLVDQEKVKTMSEKEKINLIMLPGLSTAEKISDISGRGVGMDVVKSNLDKLGGQVEIDSEVDKGTIVRVKLPLTLAIIPSLLVSSAAEHFAIAQVNVSELLRISASQIREKVEKVGDAEVLILRGELIPLLHLNQILGLENVYFDPKTNTYKPDRRDGLADQRLQEKKEEETEEPEERRHHIESDTSIVVVQAGPFKYGLVVDELHDSVEIVVKPLGRHLKNCEAYAGATIMGDGHVALILDVPGLARIAELSSMAGTERASELIAERSESKEGVTRQSLLLFRNGPEEPCAVPLDLVGRVEQIKASDIEIVGGKKVIQYRGGSLPIFALEEVSNVGMLEDREDLIVLVFEVEDKEVGLLAVPPVDALKTELYVDESTLRQRGISGSAIIKEQTTLIVDLHEIIQTLNPHWFVQEEENVQAHAGERYEIQAEEKEQGLESILLAEDSDFFRAQVKKLIEDQGYNVVEAEDGQVAWEYLDNNPEKIGLVVTDLEMPNMDGFELSSRIKKDRRFSNLQIIALTSLAAKEDYAKGQEVGIDDYQIKLDKEKLLNSIAERVAGMTT